VKTKLFIVAVIIALLCFLASPFLFGQDMNQLIESSQPSGRANDIVNFTWLEALGRPGIVAVLVFVLGYAVRRIEKLSNHWLWLLVPIGTAVYCIIGDKASDNQLENYTLKIAFGLIISTITVLVVVIAHNKVLVWASKKLPFLSFLVADDAAQPDVPKSP